MLTIAGNVVKYLRYWKTALKNRAFRCSFQREGDGESPSASLFAASLERPRESAAGASRYRSAEMCASTIRVVPRLTSPLSQGRGFIFVGADAHIGPADCIVFTVIFGEFVTSHRADVGIGPYNSLSRYSTDSHRAFAFCVCLLQPFRGAFCYRPSCRRTIMTARRAAPER